MTLPMTHPNTGSRNIPRSVGALVAGFVTVFLLSLGTDQVLHVLNVYPPWGQPMWDAGLNALALGYRIVYTILGGYIAARLAPNAPVRHAVILGAIGLAFATLGAVVTITKYDFGPDWYPILLAVTALPSSWLGGVLRQRQSNT
ncbi:MAG: hypothetical protein ACRENU_00305 [Gemmatimonadaceae bacterium]